MQTRRVYQAVVRDIDTHAPCAMYDGRFFVRFDEVGPGVARLPKGMYYDCVYKGAPLRLWQMCALDYWYTEEAAEDAG